MSASVDQGLPHQQSSSGPKLSIMVLCSRTNQFEDVLPLVGAILNARFRNLTDVVAA